MALESSQRILVRLSGDITTKAKATRKQFVRRLVRNLKDALKSAGAAGRVLRTHDRIFVEVERGEPASALARVFGVQSLSRAERRPWSELRDLVDAGLALYGDAVRGKRFAVRARRVGDRARVPIDARAVERELGTALLPSAARVDLSNPEITVRLELHPGEVDFFTDSTRGPGGLPLGVEGRAIALVSGGFDSAVAAWHLLKRGVALDYVFCNLGGRIHQLGTLRVMKEIADNWSYGARPALHAIDFDLVSREIQAHSQTRYWQVVLKRQMLRAAERVAAERGAVALVTGEAVGQVSSQTLQNMAVISRATGLPILRPLVGFNKEEIIDRAHKIGTFELSKVVREYCAIVPRKPATAASAGAVAEQEAGLDASLLDRAVAERGVFDLRALDLDKLDLPELEASGIPDGATVVDMRSLAAYGAWHYPGALFLDFAHALAAYPSFERDHTYVLYCEFGLKSAHLAELMRREGFDAYHFRHGLSDLISHCRERGVPTPDPL
ncbi:MAG: tRNA 4-thiouridine(8) synthase ThiI [Proteobacteria bacterium]|nr:tRNA 4-thiouridine(8) synthase ThiI [Pseudomonadota bacterium]